MEKTDSQPFGIMHGRIAWADTGKCKQVNISQDIFLDPNIHTALWTLGGEHFFFLYLDQNSIIFSK